MEKIIKYRQIVQQMLMEYGNRKTRVHHCSVHIDIKGGKIWLQWNATEDDIAEDLVIAGVPKEDIVWGFGPPFMRKYTGYAVE
ncbi:MAG: XisI protein [Oscillatoriales cyanobacterium]|nr:MAG: XisI protein [Oscillatoriales cyanobacterium]